MAISTKVDIYGVHSDALVKMLVQERKQYGIDALRIVPERDQDASNLLVTTQHICLRTFAQETLYAKFLPSEVTVNPEYVRYTWKTATSTDGVPVRLTNVVIESQGTLARRFLLEGGKAFYVAKHYLDVFGTGVDDLRDFQYEMVEDKGRNVILRISKQAGCVCGYIAGMRNIYEQSF